MTNANTITTIAATATNTITVFPDPVPVSLIPLPASYPLLPLNNRFQPVAYTQATADMAFVTVLVPLRPNQTLVPNSYISQYDGKEGLEYSFNVVVKGAHSDDRVNSLALLSFSFILGLPSIRPSYKIIITVSTDEQVDELGKVVMDSNMLPSKEN